MKRLTIIICLFFYSYLFSMEQINQPKSLLLLCRIAIRKQLIEDVKAGRQSNWFNESLLPDELKELLNHKSNIIWAAFAHNVKKQELKGCNTIALSPDNNFTITTNIYSSKARMWKFKELLNYDAKCLKEFIDQVETFEYVKISCDNSFIVTVAENGPTKIWQMDSGQAIAELLHDHPVRSIKISYDNNFIVSIDPFTIYLWSTKTFELLRKISPNNIKQIQTIQESLAISFDSNLVAVGLRNGKVLVIDIKTGDCIHELSGHKIWVKSIAISSDNRFIVTGSLGEPVIIWDLKTGNEISKISIPHGFGELAISNDSSFIVISTHTFISIWDSKLLDWIALLTTNYAFNDLQIGKNDNFIISHGLGKAYAYPLPELKN